MNSKIKKITNFRFLLLKLLIGKRTVVFNATLIGGIDARTITKGSIIYGCEFKGGKAAITLSCKELVNHD